MTAGCFDGNYIGIEGGDDVHETVEVAIAHMRVNLGCILHA
ncbi:Uncharacterised protein [Chlamydia trachomatis]|nr:Uncharacterised protein [Chlamydia trachomatis]